jgi:hypothetical protein
MAGGHVSRERQAEHMAAPHRFCYVKIFLANTEPSTHGPSRPSASCPISSAVEGKADVLSLAFDGCN